MNSPTNQHVASPTRAKFFRKLHRYLGLALFLPVLLLTTTGVLLEFTNALALGQTGVPFVTVHGHYNIQAPEFARQSGAVSQLGNRLLTPSRVLSTDGDLRGVYALEEFELVFLSNELIIAPHAADAPVERTPLPAYERAGFLDDFTWILESAGVYQISHDLGATWAPHQTSEAQWLAVEVTTPTPALVQRYGEAHLSWERWLQDLHSGRYFGPFGSWIMSLAGLALIALAITGLVVWLSRVRR